MDILREILKLGVFAPITIWFIYLALESRGGYDQLGMGLCVLLGFGGLIATLAIYGYALKPSILESPSKDDQEPGRS
jgi:hypothetical protein